MNNIGESKAHRLLLLLKSSSDFLVKSGIALVVRVCAAAATYAGSILMARWFGVEQFGVLAQILTGVASLSIVLTFGLRSGLIRFLGEYRSLADDALARGLIKSSYSLVVIGTVTSGALLVAISLYAFSESSENKAIAYALGALLLPAFAIVDLQSAILRSSGDIFWALAPRDFLWRLSFLPIGFFVAALSLPDYELLIFLTSIVAVLNLFAFVQWLQVRRLLTISLKGPMKVDRATWLKAIWPMWMSSIATSGLRNIDVIIVSAVLSVSQAGLYFAASRTAALVSFALTVSNLVVGPKVSRLFYSGDHNELHRYLAVAAAVVFLPTALFFLAFIFFGTWALGLFGSDFEPLLPELLILAFAQMVNGAVGCVVVVLNMTGFERVNLRILVVCSVLTIVSGSISTHYFGTLGTALCFGGGLIAWNVALAITAYRLTGFNPTIFGAYRFLLK